MAQKQKPKSERGRLNEGLKDMFMTMDPKSFREALKQLADLRDSDKPSFNQLLEKFEEHKIDKPAEHRVKDVETCQDKYDGGYLWCMMPKKKENESEAQFDIRCKRMEDNLMQVMLDVLDDCDYYIHK